MDTCSAPSIIHEPDDNGLADATHLFDCEYFSVRTASDHANSADRPIWIDRPDAVMVVPKSIDNTFIMVKQYRFPTGKHELEFPGGTIESGEAPVEAAQRELLEETGFTATACELIQSFYPSNGTSNERVHIFEARIDHRRQREAEFQIEKLRHNEIGQLIADGTITCAVTALAYLLMNRPLQ